MFHKSKYSVASGGVRRRGRGGLSESASGVSDVVTDYIAKWALEEGAGTTAFDASENSLDGTLTNGATWGDGNVGASSVSLDGTNDFIRIADSNLLSFTDGSDNDQPFSLSAWVYYQTGTASAAPILVKYTDTSPRDSEWALWIDTSDRLVGRVYDSSTAGWLGNYTTETITKNTWVHVVMTYDGTEVNAGIKLYIDNSLATSNTSNKNAYTGMENLGGDVTIGAWLVDDASFFDYFGGRIDDVRIYDRVLTTDDISDLYGLGA